MNCPKCSNRLGWNDGAFCKSCMAEVSEFAQLRADLAKASQLLRERDIEVCRLGDALATVTAERDSAVENQCAANRQWQSKWDELCAAHAETRKALEVMRQGYEDIAGDATRCLTALESARAELAKAEARVKDALHYYDGQGSVCDHMREMVRLLRG